MMNIIQKTAEVKESPKFVRNGGGMLLYLHSVLFAQHDVDLDKELSDTILKIYMDLEPSSLSKMLLDSNMKHYSCDLAIKYLSKHKKNTENKGKFGQYF